MSGPSIIDDAQAREIACGYYSRGPIPLVHAGPSPVPLLDVDDVRKHEEEWEWDGERRPWVPLTDTGEITADAHEWIDAEAANLEDAALREADAWVVAGHREEAGRLRALLAYVLHHGERPAQPGWSSEGGTR